VSCSVSNSNHPDAKGYFLSDRLPSSTNLNQISFKLSVVPLTYKFPLKDSSGVSTILLEVRGSRVAYREKGQSTKE
jgi:hypothetical protein